MEKKQTAVQKLIEHLEESYHLTEETRNEFTQALQIERVQIEEAYNKGCIDFHNCGGNDGQLNKTSQNYYTQAFKP